MRALLTEPAIILEIIIVVFIIFLQLRSYFANKKRMNEYMDIFGDSETWDVERDDLGRVASITGGSSSSYFREIKHTINKYIAGSSNSVTDYQILKEAVDRHCDSIEEQIESQTPVPLYLGLAGTMIGVIIGLTMLIFSGAITDLAGSAGEQATEIVSSAANTISSGDAEFKKATDGITSLLLGVAVAMLASFVGITLTTTAAHSQRQQKEDAEHHKNEFMSWMQSVLLPELPNDISGAMAQLVDDLEHFNQKFEENTSSLSKTFDNVNESYKTQADIVKAVQQMDMQSMATANIRVLEQLQKCTEKLERFNEYLDHIEGYTSTIQRFNEQFQQEETQLGLLRKIYDFFNKELHEIDQRKAAIGDAVSSVDEKLRMSFASLETSQAEQLGKFKEKLLEQATAFSNMLDEQREAFRSSNKLIAEKLDGELNQYPETVAKLKQISEIPTELRNLTSALTSAMSKLANDVNRSVSRVNPVMATAATPAAAPKVNLMLPKKMKWMMIGFASLITICAILAAVFCGIAAFKQQSISEQTPKEQVVEGDSVTAEVDTAAVVPAVPAAQPLKQPAPPVANPANE